MNLDAAGAAARDYSRGPEWRGGYVPGYDPDRDWAYHPLGKQHYDDDLRIASANYWAGKTGREEPPPPSYHGTTLGRLMDPYGAQAMMRRNVHDWRKVFWKLVMAAAVILAVGAEVPLAAVVLLIVVLIPFLAYRSLKKHRYMKYYRAQAQMLRTGEPLWMPFSAEQIRKMTIDARFMWP